MRRYISFRPRLADCLRDYTAADFLRDTVAGVTVGIVALPLSMALAIASGVAPAAGIYTAVVAGFLISALGGARVQIGGPTGAFVAIVYGVVAQHGLANLAICTVMAGVILLLMGFARMGSMIKFIPHPVTMGFTCGIAVLLFSTQIKDFLGLRADPFPPDFPGKLAYLFRHGGEIHRPTLLLAVLAVLGMALWPARFGRRVPGSIVVIGLATAAVAWADAGARFGIETIGSRFGGVPQGLPPLGLPDFRWDQLADLVRPATTIALLAAIESLLCAVVSDGMIEDRHDSNQELKAQGLANIASALCGGIPATGAIARTATNVRSGARSPVAGMIHALTLLAMMLVAAPLARHIPLAALSAVLVMVAFKMGEWHMFARLPRWPKSDAVVFLTAFGLTVLVDLTVAVEVGMVLAALLFIRRIAETTHVGRLDEAFESDPSRTLSPAGDVPEGVLVYRIFGAFLFGAADKLETALKRADQEPRVLVLRMSTVLAMDATGLNALEDLWGKLRRKHRHLVLSGPHTQPLLVMSRAGFLEQLGHENVCANIEHALARARALLALETPRTSDP